MSIAQYGPDRANWKRDGFTLVELLVVVAVIALLAAILFPVFGRIREKARSATCQSNLKQIAMAFHQYTTDYDERLPHAWDSDLAAAPQGFVTCNNCTNFGGNTNVPVLWPAKIQPYIKSRQVFTCPDDTSKIKSSCGITVIAEAIPVWRGGDPVIGYNPAGTWWWTGASQVGYGYNTYYLGGNRYGGLGDCLNQVTNSSLPYSNGTGALLSTIADSAQTVLLCDNSYSSQGSNTPPAFLDFPTLKARGADADGDVQCRADGSWDASDSIPTRHSDGLNVAFLDGHVKWMKKGVLMYDLTAESCLGSAAIHTSTDPKFLWNRF